MEKVQVSQDTLYEYMLAHDVKIVRLAEMMGKDPDTVSSCFKHRKDVHGEPRSFNASNIKKINELLPLLASELRSCLLSFGSPQTFTNKHGRTYDPGLVEPIKALGRYLNITGLVFRVFGWNKYKKGSVLANKASVVYGNISQADAIAINNEILSIAGVLDSYEVVLT